jgi:hypothetical protein
MIAGYKLAIVAAVLAVAISPAVQGADVDDCRLAKTEASLALLQQLRDAGLPLEKPREVTHLFLGDASGLLVAQKTLVKLGMKIVESGSGRLLVSLQTPVSENWVKSTMDQMCKVAADTGSEYDGWDIDVAAEHVKAKPAT